MPTDGEGPIAPELAVGLVREDEEEPEEIPVHRETLACPMSENIKTGCLPCPVSTRGIEGNDLGMIHA